MVAELLLKHADGRHHPGVRRRQHLVHRHCEGAGVQVFVAECLGESSDLLVVAELEHPPLDQRSGAGDRGPAHLPHSERFVELDRPVQPNPQHHLGVEVAAWTAP